MLLSLKQEIETWVTALAAYDNNEFDSALKCFEQIADTSKILFNCGVIHATLGEHLRAVTYYQEAVKLDQFLAIAYFQQGVSNFLMGDFEEALANFNDTLLYLRGNNNINYEQLGLKFKLYSCEVLFNRGLCYIYLQQKQAGMQDLAFATREKMVPDHDVIDEAIREEAEGYTVFSIPVGVVYRPNEAKVKNLKTKDYLGRARLVAAQAQQQAVDPRRKAALAAMGIDDRPEEKLSYAALNMVRTDIRSRSHRQQSEPPLNRTVFPPTPPPELERPDSASGYRASVESEISDRSFRSSLQQSRPAAKPLRLELGAAAFDQKSAAEPQRQRPKRSESERPALRAEHSGSFHGQRRDQPRSSASRRDTIPELRIEEDPVQAHSDQATQPQRVSTHSSVRSSAPRNHPLPIEEVEEEDEEDNPYPGESPSDSHHPLAFEIIAPRSTQHQHQHASYRPQSRRAAAAPLQSPPPAMRKIRIKVHAEDMRYVMTAPTVGFAEVSEQIRKKFAFREGAYKIKTKDDEGDLVTMGDQEDWDMAVASCIAAAAREASDMGKMEVWVQEV